MSDLRVVVNFPEGAYDVEKQTEVLSELQKALKDQMGLQQRLTRLPQLSLPGGPQQTQPRLTPTPQQTEEVALRVFLLEFPDAAACASALRAVGGWYMRYPELSLSLKADGPRGGVNLRLKSFSTVAFARAVSQVTELMEEPDAAEG